MSGTNPVNTKERTSDPDLRDSKAQERRSARENLLVHRALGLLLRSCAPALP
jgi:hypothetical protein